MAEENCRQPQKHLPALLELPRAPRNGCREESHPKMSLLFPQHSDRESPCQNTPKDSLLQIIRKIFKDLEPPHPPNKFRAAFFFPFQVEWNREILPSPKVLIMFFKRLGDASRESTEEILTRISSQSLGAHFRAGSTFQPRSLLPNPSCFKVTGGWLLPKVGNLQSFVLRGL